MNNVGNGIYLLDVPITPQSGLVDKATAFRKAITHSRERPNLEALVSKRSSLGFEMMQDERIMPWSSSRTMLINGLQW